MEVAGLTLAVVAEVRELLRSLKQRYQNVIDNPITFSNLMHDASRIEEDIRDCNTQLTSKALHLPQPCKNLVHRRFKSIKSRFEDSQLVLGEFHSKAFPHPHSGAASRVTSRARQTFKAKALSNELEKVALIFRDANIEIIGIANLLGISHISEKLAQNNDSCANRCKSTTPALTHRAFLRYDGCDESGNPTPENQLKQCILGTSGSTVTAAKGHAPRSIGPVPSAQGMAGVGKTIALKGLAADEDIRKHFTEIHYLTLGHDATTPKVVSELARIVRESGGESQAEKVCKCSDLGEAVRASAEWFSSKACLFLVDDVWQTSQSMHGYLPDLRQLLSSCEHSRMAISTRDRGIAREAGQWVKFGARDAQTSREIFLRYFDTGKDVEWSSKSVESSLQNVLQLCGGLPLALAIAGRATQQLVELYGSAKEALVEYATKLRNKKSSIVNASSGEYKSLRSAIEVSLDFLDENMTSEHSGEYTDLRMARHSFGDLYRALSVLKAQSWAPISMLERLWRFNRTETSIVMELFCNLSLASSEYRWYDSMRSCKKYGQICLSTHDLQLEYCQEQARASKSNKTWHKQLLEGYLGAAGDDMELQDTEGTGNASRNANTGHGSKSVRLSMNISAIQGSADPWTTRPRLWWSDDVYDDNYIYANLARHLVQGGNAFELLALLLDARWTKLRLKVGGILALQEDFAALIGHEKTYGDDDEYEQTRRYAEDLSAILNAIRCSWQYISEIARQMPMQLGARLFELRKISVAARRYLKSVEENTERPFLEARSPFLPDAGSAQVSELQLNGICNSLDISSCGKYIVVGDENDVMVIDQRTLAVVSRLKKGYEKFVTSVCFIPHSSKRISGAECLTVKVWDMSKPHEDVLTLRGHTGKVMDVCASSDGALVASGSLDKTVRIWDLRGGAHKCNVLRGHTNRVWCVCFSPDGARVASGSSDKTVRLWDIQSVSDVSVAIEGHSGSVLCVAFSPDSYLLASGSQDRTIRLWNARSGACTGKVLQGHRTGVNSVSFSADGARIVSASKDRTVRVWDAQTCAVVGVLQGHTAQVRSAKFICDSTQVVSGSDDKTLRVWDLTKARVTYRGRERRSGCISCVAFSADGAIIAAGFPDDKIRLWDGQNGVALGRLLKVDEGMVCVALSADGSQLALGSRCGKVHLWEVATGARLCNALEGHTDRVNCVAFSPDGVHLASGSHDGTVRLWDFRRGAAMGDALGAQDFFGSSGDGGGVWQVRFSADGTKVASLLNNMYWCVWSVLCGRLLWMSRNELSEAEAQVLTKGADMEHELVANATQRIHCDGSTVMMRHNRRCIPLGTLPQAAKLSMSDRTSSSVACMYFEDRNEFVVVLQGGIIAVLRLKS